MKNRQNAYWALALLGMAVLFFPSATTAQDRNISPEITWEEIGKIKPRHARDIESSGWSVGAETQDRDYSIYKNFKEHLGPLGAKMVRLQGGWAKTEKTKGKYDFEWLDEVVDDANAQGVAPWVEFSYGNPIYEGGGEAKLGGGIPRSEEALGAWDNWVRAMTERYKDKVKTWEIWNEPDLIDNNSPEDFAKFHIRTGELVKSIQPDAEIWALALAKVGDTEYTDKFMAYLQKEGKLDLVDRVLFHGYRANPSDTYPDIEKLREVVYKYKPGLTMMQGENGAPSTEKGTAVGALRQYDWSETSQAKWFLRRMMGDLGWDFETNVFTLIDLHYGAGDHMTGINTKGLIRTNPDKTVAYLKPSYFAVQNVTAIFDHQIERVKDFKYETNAQRKTSAYAYKKKGTGENMAVVWFSDDKPGDGLETMATDFTFPGLKFSKPVIVDLLSGKVYKIPKGGFQKKNQFKGVPMYDSPVLIVEGRVLDGF